MGKNYLGRLPLAVAQAAAYVRQRNRQGPYTVNDYLEDYQKGRQALLAKDSLSAKWSNTAHEPVAVTWLMNIKDLRKKEPLAEN